MFGQASSTSCNILVCGKKRISQLWQIDVSMNSVMCSDSGQTTDQKSDIFCDDFSIIFSSGFCGCKTR